jgi:hypothetical protein
MIRCLDQGRCHLSDQPSHPAELSEQERAAISARLTKAMSHPFRARALIVLNERVASPQELADELGEDRNRAAYHVRELHRTYECIELVRTEPRRGAVKHFYRAIKPAVLWGSYWTAVPLPTREGTSASILKKIFTDATTAFNEGTFEGHPNRHLSRTPLYLDREGWEKLNIIYDEALERVLDEVKPESANRIANGAQGFHAEAAQLTFVLPGPPSSVAKTPSAS